MQVLREQQGTASAQVRVWTEEGCTTPTPAEAAEPLNPALLRLPLWTDVVLQCAQDQQLPALGTTATANETSIQLPQSITWQRIPEPMRVTALRLLLGGHAAAEIQQGMVCGLTISILSADHEMANGHQQDQVRTVEIAPASFEVHDCAMLSVSLDVPVEVDERVRLSAVGRACGAGDAVYLASWGSPATSQSFTDDAMETAYVLSHGDESSVDACLVQVLLHQFEDAGKMILVLMTRQCCMYMHSMWCCTPVLCVLLLASILEPNWKWLLATALCLSVLVFKASNAKLVIEGLCLLQMLAIGSCDRSCIVQMTSHQVRLVATPSQQPSG